MATLLGGALLALACARPGILQTALHGDLASLKRDVKESQARGELDKDAVEDLAQAIAGREVRSASGSAAVERVREVRVCARPLLRVLEDRSEQADDAAAEATLVLLELGRRDRKAMIEKHRDASAGAWRALAARAAVGPEHGPLRRKLFTDPDERARRAALRAAIETRSKDDLEPLLEAARVDPDALSRGIATRAVGAIGGERAVLALKDHWARADEPTRLTIIEAWGMPAAFKSGGEHELVTVAETRHGREAISAADALVRAAGASAPTGEAILQRAVAEGTRAERRLAIQLVPLADPDARKAVEKASKDKDEEVRIAALLRLASTDDRKKSLEGLRELAKKDDETGLEARAALAKAGDHEVKPKLTPLLSAPKARFRSTAAKGLIELGDYSAAATALADDDPSVRTEVACAVLSR